MGGRGGPYRLDSGHPVNQISDDLKNQVSKEVKEAAKAMAKEALENKLKEIKLSSYQANVYEKFYRNIIGEINQLKLIIQSLNNKGKERVWLKNKSSGDIDDSKLVDALSGHRF